MIIFLFNSLFNSLIIGSFFLSFNQNKYSDVEWPQNAPCFIVTEKIPKYQSRKMNLNYVPFCEEDD